MASQEEVNNQRRLNEETERTLTLEQELISILARRVGINSDILSGQQDVGNVLSEQLKLLKFQQQEKRLIKSITTDLNRLARDNYGTSIDQIGNDKARIKLNKDIALIEANIRVLRQQQVKFQKDANNLTGEEAELASNIALSIKDQIDESTSLVQNLKEIKELSQQTADNFGTKMFKGIADLTQAIPGLRKFSEPFQKASEASRGISAEIEEAIRSKGFGLNAQRVRDLGLDQILRSKSGKLLTGTAAANRLAGLSGTQKGIIAMKAGFKALAPILKKALGPLVIITELVSALFKANKETVELQKSMALSSTEASKFRLQMSKVAADSNDINVTTSKLLESFSSLNKQFGFITNFAGSTLATMTKLTKVVGTSAESAGNLAALSELSGKSFESNYKDVLATSYELQRQSGVQMDLRDILEQSGKVTGQVRANLGANPVLIAEAITQAKLFGASLNDVADASKALLNFEQSIENELQAELLLGRDINLERARAAALAGDQVTLAQELQKQAGSYGEFMQMNVLQQEALAAAMGMQTDAIADALFQQEIQGKNARELRALGKDDLADRLEAQTAQDKFNASVEKLKGLLVDVMTVLTPILDIVGYIADGIAWVLDAVGPFKNTLTGIAAGAAIGGPWGAAIGGVIGAAGDIIAMDDGIIPAGYGDTIIKKGKNTIALNNNDSAVIAGTNLGGGGTDMSETNQLLKILVKQNDKKPEISPTGLYQVQ